MQARIGPLQAFVNNPGVNNPGRQFCRMQKMPPEKPPLLEARNLVRRHPDGRRWLLDDVSLEVHAAARISVTGPSGAGKTLLLRALAMLDPLDGGQLFWKGRPVVGKDVPRFRRDLLYLHQRSAMLQQTVEAALRRPFLLAVHRQRQFDRGRLVGWLGELGRGESFLRKRTDDLSGGETQIVALLRALQLDPSVLLLDEPTAALDSSTTSAVEELLKRRLAESPHAPAMVWVTHDAKQGRRVAERTLRMEAGRLQGAE